MTDPDQLSWALSRILELEEALEEANNVIRRLRDGSAVEWEDVDNALRGP